MSKDNNQENIKDIDYLRKFRQIAIVLSIFTAIYGAAIYFIANKETATWGVGTFGDSFGALNALFSGLAFAGVIITILIQKSELNEQQKELRLTRGEFATTRATNLIFKQLERIDFAIQNFEVDINDKISKGIVAISTFNDEVGSNDGFFPDSKIFENTNEKMLGDIVRSVIIAQDNYPRITYLCKNTAISIAALEHILFTSKLPVEEIEDLRKLFIQNIGFETINFFNKIINLCESENDDRVKELNHMHNNGLLNKASMHAFEIIYFCDNSFTEENFEELKNNWAKKIKKP